VIALAENKSRFALLPARVAGSRLGEASFKRNTERMGIAPPNVCMLPDLGLKEHQKGRVTWGAIKAMNTFGQPGWFLFNEFNG
jgi:hypothetical protein